MIDKRDVWTRAVRTFWQAGLSYLLADAALLREALENWSGARHLLLSLAVGAVAAGFSAVYNAFVVPWMEGEDRGRK